MKNNQKGFSVVEFLLVLIAIILLAGVGWYVYQSTKKADENLNNAEKSTTTLTTADKNTNNSKDMSTYKSKKTTLSFSYPKAWGTVSEEQKPAIGDGTGNSVNYTFDKNEKITLSLNSKDYKVTGIGSACGAYDFLATEFKAFQNGTTSGVLTKVLENSEGFSMAEVLLASESDSPCPYDLVAMKKLTKNDNYHLAIAVYADDAVGFSTAQDLETYTSKLAQLKYRDDFMKFAKSLSE